MADFGEICPIFNTGVYREITLPTIELVAKTSSQNIHLGYMFAKTVVVTNAWVAKAATGWATSTMFRLVHMTTKSITIGSMTLVGSHSLCISAASQTIGHALTMNMATCTTFSSTDLLGSYAETIVDGSAPVSVIIRYRDA